MIDDTSFRLFSVLLATGDLQTILAMPTLCFCIGYPYLDLDKTRGGILLLLILILVLVEEVHLHAELVADLIHTSTLRADDTSNKFLSDLELSRLYTM